MSEDAPREVVLARKASESLVAMARKNLRLVFESPEAWQRFSKESVGRLRRHAVEEPDARALAEFICEMTPGEFLRSEIGASGTHAAIKNITSEARMLKLRAAVIEAGLVEQQGAKGSMLEGESFNAGKLEATLDAWLASGAHRGAEFYSAPLTRIDATLSAEATTPTEPLEIRLGLLIPVITGIHIWRVLEEYSDDMAQNVGWSKTAPDAETSEAPQAHSTAT